MSNKYPNRWKPGQSGNPKGRVKTPAIELLRKAMQETELEKRKSLFKHVVERAYQSDVVAIAVFKKLIPDLSEVDGGMTIRDIMAVLTQGTITPLGSGDSEPINQADKEPEE